MAGMIPETFSAFARLLASLTVVLLLGACSSAVTGPGGKITKVKYYHLQPGVPQMTQVKAVNFEREHFLYGAVTAKEINARFGHYYTILWRAFDRQGPVKVRLEYRMANSGLKIFTKEVLVEDVRRSNTTHFEVNGSEYQKNGRVTMWKASILRGREELVSQKSFLWN